MPATLTRPATRRCTPSQPYLRQVQDPVIDVMLEVVTRTEGGLVLQRSPLAFETGTDRLARPSRETLARHARMAHHEPGAETVIEGRRSAGGESAWERTRRRGRAALARLWAMGARPTATRLAWDL